MRIGILGTRGIPNHYGGFEQWAEQLSVGLVERGCEVYVYNSHNHPYQEKKWNGVVIVHQYDPEYKFGTVGQFIYDLNCIIDSRKRKLDVILQLGYTSSSIWGWLLPKRKTLIVSNMDGFEWERDKFSKKVKFFLKQAEKLAVYFSDYIIADSPVIEDYYKKNYKKPLQYIPYGTTLFSDDDMTKIQSFKIKPYEYKLLIARLEPENNIETIIKGVLKSDSSQPLLIIGNYDIPHGKYLFKKYQTENQIRFLGVIYDKDILNNLRFFSKLYFHGHSVGGTNPSLLEAMASSALICAHDNPYNRSVLANMGYFFNTLEDIARIIDGSKKNSKEFLNNNRKRVEENFLLESIIDQYHKIFQDEYRLLLK
jgi:glycosyltransferase involved in cell wall biosynthesis